MNSLVDLLNFQHHGLFGAGERVGVLRAVDAAGVELVHDLRLRNLDEAERAEERRREREDDDLLRTERRDLREDGLDEQPTDAATAERRLHRDGNNLDGRRLGVPDLGMDLVRRAPDELGARLRKDKAVDQLNDIIDALG